MNNAVHYEDALMVKAAWYYYFENMTQQAIADRLSISRMRVIKLLETARQNGVIQFRLRSDSVGMMQQSRELMQKYHLNDVFIIPEAEQEVQQRWQAFDRKANDLLDQYHSTDGLPSEET